LRATREVRRTLALQRGDAASTEKRHLFVRPLLVGADIDPTPSRGSRNVDRRGSFRIASSDRYRPGFQPEIVDELGGIEANKHALGAATIDDVVASVFARFEDAKIGLPVRSGISP